MGRKERKFPRVLRLSHHTPPVSRKNFPIATKGHETSKRSTLYSLNGFHLTIHILERWVQVVSCLILLFCVTLEDQMESSLRFKILTTPHKLLCLSTSLQVVMLSGKVVGLLVMGPSYQM